MNIVMKRQKTKKYLTTIDFLWFRGQKEMKI